MTREEKYICLALGLIVYMKHKGVKLNNVFKEQDHPRDEGGRFTDGNKGSSSSKTLEIKGTELGTYTDIKELRQKAIEYYKENFQGKPVYREGIGNINFSNKGIKETISHSGNNEDKLKCIVAIKDIILNGKIGKEEKPNHPRKDEIVSFIPINKLINLNGKNKEIEVLVAKDISGKYYYDLFTNGLRQKKTSDRYLKQNPGPSEDNKRAEPTTKAGNSPDINIITNNSDNVNSFEDDYVLNIFINESEE